MPSPDLSTFRAQFPALANKIYFNYGGQGPLSDRAFEAIVSTERQIQTDGPFNGKINAALSANSGVTRSAIADLLGVPETTISLTEDVTVGCNIALWGLAWQAGDQIVLTDCEHPGVMAAVAEIARRFDLTVTIAPILNILNDGDPVAAIVDRLTPRTRLVIVSHLLWNTGSVLPLAEINRACHQFPTETGQTIRVLVDAAQSVGTLPLDLDAIDVDFYAFTGHKWLCGAAGVGGLYVSEAARQDLAPTFIGWRSIETDAVGNPTDWKPNGRRYEVATSAYPLYAGLREAIAVHDEWGTATERYAAICDRAFRLWSGLHAIDGVDCWSMSPPRSGLVSFTHVGGQHQTLVNQLEARGLMLRTILHPDCVRACVHYFTTEDEIDQLLTAIADFSRSTSR
ncbi:MAG: aminotransferase class V-fold PLP-dependent enzyme [Coleofasciculaceae cyanobacterium RL_1_1]|nr:aminotransferase class V-fold PLP-dependent enzyme [Coleofasciculaceae cyanobacterium RL_1_1]